MNEQPNLEQRDSFELRRAGKLQGAIHTTDFTPTKPDFVKKPSWGSKLWGKIKHGLYTAATAVSAVAINGLAYVGTWLFTSSSKEKEVKTELDPTLIPGTKNDHFKDIDPDTLPEQQPVIDDTRRMPVVFEKPIPEDPDQKPTITFEVDQAKEGDSVGYARVKNGDGEKETEMGHGFIRMKYTRTDPLTGLPQRYQVSFGFYPKGGFIGANAMIAQIQNGMYVPGQLNDDIGHPVSVGKTFTVSNREINKVFLAAQRYEKDGYNFIKRNCTTFVRDMATVAGLNVDDLMYQTDLDSKEVKAGSVGLLFAGMTMSRLGKIQMLSKAGKNDLSYQRFGQKMLNKEDIRRLDKRKLNLRLYGYQPGHTAESIRSAPDFHIHSKKFETKLDDPHNTKKTRPADYYLRATRKEMENLIAEIHRYGRKHKLDLTSRIEELDSFADGSLEAVEEALRRVYPGQRVPEAFNYAKRRQDFYDGAAAINRFLSGMDRIFRETFHSEPKLNVAFQHVVSNMEWMKDGLNRDFAELQPSELVIAGYKQSREEPESEGLDTSRDAYYALRLLKYGQYSEMGPRGISINLRPTKMAAGCIVFGNVKNTMDKLRRMTELALKEQAGGLNKEEKKEQSAINREVDLMEDMARAQDSIYSGRELTASDYRLAFCTLPDAEKDWNMGGATAKRPSELYRAICFEKAFPGMRKELEKTLDDLRKEIEKSLKSMNERYASKYDPFLKQEMYFLRNRSFDYIGAKFSEILEQRMKNNPVLDRIEGAMIEDYTEKNPPRPDENLKEYDKRVRETVGRDLTNKLMDGYIDKMLTESPAMKNPNRDPAQELVGELFIARIYKPTTLDKDPSYAPLRNALRGRLGLEFREEAAIKEETEEYRRQFGASILCPPMGIFKDEVTQMHRDVYSRLQEQKQAGTAKPENPAYVQAMAELLMLTGIRRKLNEDKFPYKMAMYRRTMSEKAAETAKEWGLKSYLSTPEGAEHLDALLSGHKEKEGFAPEKAEDMLLASANSWKLAVEQKQPDDPKAVNEKQISSVQPDALIK